MAFTIDFREETVEEWHATATGVEVREIESYTPTIYASADTASALSELANTLDARWDVAGAAFEEWRTAFRRPPESVLRIDVASVDRIEPLAGWIRRKRRPDTYRLFNVDFSREFRYCLERGLDPVPDRQLAVLDLTDPTPGAPAPPLTELTIDGEPVSGGEATVCQRLREQLQTVDPDVLVVSSAELVPALFETGEGVQLGRRPGYEQLAGESTYESYGQVGHSPARYNVPGRVLLDCSNTFFYRETNLDGCLDLVARSRKPLQELSWASIGNVLTAIQIREARDRGVLVPWKSRRHELPKTMAQLHDADRGGFTFSPVVGVHETVHELDFASLYPNIICTRNVSPETIRCSCHDRADVPGLGYSVCDQPGYLPAVLEPIIDARDDLKRRIEATDDPARREALEGKSAALKWILVSCFGYQGFSNAKFGRIECHEAINAYAREILLDAKSQLEACGWRVVHGIVDSLWVTAREDCDQRDIEQVAAAVTEKTGIRLEYEGAYDWIAFVPRRKSNAGALTRYFGRRRDGSYNYRGIECRQRSTAPFVADCQQRLIEVFDTTRDPEQVCAELAGWVARLWDGAIETDRLVRQRRTTRDRNDYDRSTRTTAALDRCASTGLAHAPGQDVQYVVVDDSKSGRERVRLAHETGDSYDASFYRSRLLRAAESVLSPVGWRADDIAATLDSRESATLGRFT